MTRDPKFIFQSIFLKAKSAGEINIEGFRLNQILNNKDYFKYLMSQIKKSNKKIISDLNETNSSFMVVDYSDICNNTNKTLDQISKFLSLKKNRKSIDLKSNIYESKSIRLSNSQWLRLNKFFS